MKKKFSGAAAAVCLLVVSAHAQLFLREPFTTVAGTPDTARGEYQTGLDMGDTLHNYSAAL